MELGLGGKVALVTGGSRGIGKAIAARFAEAGARVMISSRKADALEKAAASIDGEVTWFVANVGDRDSATACVQDCFERLGGLDVLVNNAGTSPYFGPLMGLDDARARKTVQVNQDAVLMWTRLAWQAAMSKRGGSVINLASVGGLSVEAGIGWYNVTKAAVIHLTRQLAWELGPSVRVNALAPGLVKTDFARALWEGAEDAIASRLPLSRLGEPDDVAKAALFLASDAASWITGQTLVVDGGAMVMPSGGLGAGELVPGRG
ncbi:MAG: SDR family oxidoreductase [Acidimicrobiales bacterium]|jgi:NAD(P)-dependent dehydrogenase (short-subunit alcohol dehydrogenase family)